MSPLLTFLGLVLVLRVSCSYAPLPGQDFVLQGYDYIAGNPMEWEAIDPGYQDDVFVGIVNKTSITVPFGNTDYSLYAGLSGSCSLSCGASYSYSSITGIEEYYNMLYQHVSISKHGLFESFAMSETYKKVNEAIQINKNVAANTWQQCALCKLSVNGFNAGPPFSTEFNNAIKAMPTTTNNDWFYENFMPHFGTHYVSQIQLGAIYGMFAEMNRYSYESFDSSNLDISVSASAFANSLAGCSETKTEHQEASYFHSVTINAATYNMGAPLPQNMSSANWQKEIEDKKEVGPTYIEIAPLSDLVSNSQKKAALNNAINGYCAWLKKNKDSSLNCANLPPDGPSTNREIFRGFYVPPNNSPVIGKNPYTSPLESNCPEHFKPYEWLQDAQGNNVWKAYMCLNETIMDDESKKEDATKMFGGFWMTNKNNNGCDYGNPMNNGQCECVTGYNALKVYTYCQADGQMISGYLCLNTNLSPSNNFIGGAYQTGYYKIDNHWTNGINCPQPHKAYPVAQNFVCNGKSSNDKCSLYVCLSNIYPLN